ncbi:hypothetical protein [Vibrio barjaei]|jgi:hypothetical protein|uniref:hypothetical protein n=1 Tax=Vibrio barjaei TaxID=1676683 RepID=UPI000A98F816|nr:hypothetical protein [Vibrio barjaei]MCG9788291.1 hypothetical protein [Vibrio mediterranei]MCY9874269.1 hypothetical protein [Vibrio barjaei]
MKLMVLALCIIGLTGCQLTRVQGSVKDVEVDVRSKGHSTSNSSSTFCPPGQAKKGRC